jgi:putative spermidine/putrescine transport system permease protein
MMPEARGHRPASSLTSPDGAASALTAAAPLAEAAAEGRERRRYLYLLLPAVLVLVVLFVVPLLGILNRSVFSLTFRTAAVVTLICLALGYPLAYVLVNVRPRVARLLMIVVVLPFFTSIIVRTYAWMVLLGRNGIVNQYLIALGFTDTPLPFLYNQTGVLIGMSYVLLPFLILTAYSVMRGIDPGLIRAAHSLGASRFQAFRRIFLPLSLPGIAGGTLLVFILSLGFFITPALMGGPSDIMIAMLIEREVEFTLNWSFASALAVILLLVTLVGFALYNRIVRLERVFEGRA